jgi:hypothetical protein
LGSQPIGEKKILKKEVTTIVKSSKVLSKTFYNLQKVHQTTIENNSKHQFELFHWPQFKPMGL